MAQEKATTRFSWRRCDGLRLSGRGLPRAAFECGSQSNSLFDTRGTLLRPMTGRRIALLREPSRLVVWSLASEPQGARFSASRMNRPRAAAKAHAVDSDASVLDAWDRLAAVRGASAFSALQK